MLRTNTLTFKDTLRACYFGYITQAIVNNIAPLLFVIFQDAFTISYEMLGRLVLINFGTQIAADIVSMRIADRVGYRKMAVAAHLFSAVGLIALGVLPQVMASPYMGLVIAVVIYAIGGGIIEVLISPIVESLPGEQKASAMSLLHSFYCWGQLTIVIVTTLLLYFLGTGIWFFLPALWALVPLYNLINFLRVPLLPTVAEHERTSLRTLLAHPAFVTILMLMICAGASELTMSQWSSLFADRALELPKVVGDLLGPALFALTMGIGRTIYGVWGDRLDLKRAMLWSGLLCIACYLTAVFAAMPMLSMVGLALCGFSVSLMWPGSYSLSAAAFPRGGVAMFGILAVFGDIGAAVGPWLAGFVSDVAQRSTWLLEYATAQSLAPDQIGLKAGLFVATIFPLLMVIGVLYLRRDAARPVAQQQVAPAD